MMSQRRRSFSGIHWSLSTNLRRRRFVKIYCSISTNLRRRRFVEIRQRQMTKIRRRGDVLCPLGCSMRAYSCRAMGNGTVSSCELYHRISKGYTVDCFGLHCFLYTSVKTFNSAFCTRPFWVMCLCLNPPSLANFLRASD